MVARSAVLFYEKEAHNCGMTMMSTKPQMIFTKWHVVETRTQLPGKDRTRRQFLINFEKISKFVFIPKCLLRELLEMIVSLSFLCELVLTRLLLGSYL